MVLIKPVTARCKPWRTNLYQILCCQCTKKISSCWSICVSVFILSFYNALGFPKRCPCYLKWRLLVLVVKLYFYVLIHITVEVVFRPGILVVKTETPDLQRDILFQSSLVPVRSQLLRLLHRFGHVLKHQNVHIRTFPSKSRLIQQAALLVPGKLPIIPEG